MKFERMFVYPETPLFEGKRWWISDLGAIADDGEVLLAKFGWMPKKTGTVTYEWQTWSIEDEKQMGRGLRVGNGEVGGR